MPILANPRKGTRGTNEAVLTRFSRHRCEDSPQCIEREDASATTSQRKSCRTEAKALLCLKIVIETKETRKGLNILQEPPPTCL